MEKFDVDCFYKQLRSSKIGRKCVYVDTTGSTMDDARRLAHEVKEYPHGTIVMSEQQTKARGARDHKWDATNTGNIYASIVLHMPPSGRTFEGRFDLEVAACLAVLQVVRAFGITKVIPKWPNDLWVRGHKLAGFLLEDGRYDIPGTTDCLFILGMGINVNADVRRSSELQSIATSMVCERDGQYVDREQFLADVCLQLEQTLANKKDDNYSMFLKENLFQEDCEISVSTNMGEMLDGKFVTICKNWDVKFVDTFTGKVMRGSSAVYTIRPKVVNKIIVVFNSIHNTNLASFMSKWLTSVIDTSKYVVCSVPESTVTSTDEWMKKCSLLVLVEDVHNRDLLTTKTGLYLRSGGSIMSSGQGAPYLASILDIHAEEVLLESSRESVVVLALKTETSLLGLVSDGSVTSATDGSLPVLDSLSVSDSEFRNKPNRESVEALGAARHQPQTVTFPTKPPCFSFSISEDSGCQSTDIHQNELHLKNLPFRQSLVPTSISSHGVRISGYLSSGDQEKKLVVLAGNVISGGLVALWGFNVTNVLEENRLSVEEINHVVEDRFKRDVFLQQVLKVLLKS